MAYFGHTETLDANEEVVLGPTNTDRADTITGGAWSSHAGTLFVEQSGDGDNWDLSEEVAVGAGNGEGFSVPLFLPYVRIRYVNGGTATDATRIFARFGSAGDS